MGALINSDKLDFCPFIDWKNHNLYFTSERTVIENKALNSVHALNELANSTLNGFGNIYKIGLSELENLD